MSSTKDKSLIDLEVDDSLEVERTEEAKLLSKYPMGRETNQSLFLQKRLHKGYKFFDSGEYQMAKQSGNTHTMDLISGGIIPTLETVSALKHTISTESMDSKSKQ